MLERLGDLVVRRRWAVLAVSVVVMSAAGMLGGGVADRLSGGGFEDPDAESSQAQAILEDRYGIGSTNLVLLVTAPEGRTVDDPAVAAAGKRLTGELTRSEGITNAGSYWSLAAPPLRSEDGRQALVLASIGGDEDAVSDHLEEIEDGALADTGSLTVEVTGAEAVGRQIGEEVESGLLRAEMIAIPITLLLLLLVFRSLVAAGLPLLVGGLAILGTFLVLTGLAAVTDVSIFALNLTTAMGLGLAIDYALFIVSRYREEVAAGCEPDEAVRRTVATAGRTVVFSAFTVAASLSALLVFPQYFLRSFAYAGIAVTLVAATAAVVTLPAVLALLGHRIDALSIRHRPPTPVGDGVWHRLAVLVMRRPIPIATAVVALLVVLGLPFLGVSFGSPDDRVLPEDASTRVALDQIRNGFSSAEQFAASVVVPGVDASTRADDVAAYATELSRVDGVARVDAATGVYADGQRLLPPGPVTERFSAEAGTWLSLVPEDEPQSEAGQAMVQTVRDLDGPFDDVFVGGNAASLVDTKAVILDRLPVAALIIVAVTFVLLFAMFGSVLLPVKALVLNLLSLTATFGAMVWIFQDGNLSGVLDFTPTGLTDTTTPILMFCIAFGLSMDYEVFLLSRIKEEYDRSHDNDSAVAIGLERTGRIVTAAALLLAVVFVAFATSGVSFIKLFGVGLTMAVLMDATLVRGLLVPAFMRMARGANWWAPPPLRRLHERFGMSDSPPVSDAPRATGDVRPKGWIAP